MKLAVWLLLLKQAVAFPEDCPNITVIHDVNGDKWYDGCLGLDHKPKITTAAECEKICKADIKCSVWQFVKPGTGEGCWAGYPTEGCQSRTSAKALATFDGKLAGGQRLQHGFIKLLNGSLAGKMVQNLKKLDFVVTESAETEIKRCKMVCYTDTTCTAWQFKKTGTDGFCMVEHLPGNKKGETLEDADKYKEYLAGETIEHVCPAYVPPKAELPWPWIIAGSLLGLAALIFLLMFCCMKKPKVKKTRAVKIEKPKETPAPVQMYFVPQPTMLVPQQSVIMQQPLVQQPLMTTPIETFAPVATAPQYTVLR